MAAKISSSQYYNEYHGHKVQHLSKVYPLLRENSDVLIWTAGDSSLDNKYWWVLAALGSPYFEVLIVTDKFAVLFRIKV
jgi:hypothetical protein